MPFSFWVNDIVMFDSPLSQKDTHLRTHAIKRHTNTHKTHACSNVWPITFLRLNLSVIFSHQERYDTSEPLENILYLLKFLEVDKFLVDFVLNLYSFTAVEHWIILVPTNILIKTAFWQSSGWAYCFPILAMSRIFVKGNIIWSASVNVMCNSANNLILLKK